MIALTLGIVVLFALLRFLHCDTLLVRFWCLIWGASAAGAIPLETLPWWHVGWSTLPILVFTTCLGIGAFLGQGRPHRLPAGHPDATPWNRQFPAKLHWKLGLACLPLSYLSVHLLLGDLRQGYEVFSSIDSIVASAAAASIARYHEDFDPSAPTRALITVVYLSAFICGWYASRADAPRRWALFIVSILPALGWTILLTTKANFLFWLVYAFAGFVAFGNSRTRATRSRWKLIGWVSAIAALSALMLGVQLSRLGADSLDGVAEVVEALSVAGLGHVFALRQWAEDSMNWLPQAMGTRSFGGILELIGIAPREQGLYGEQNVAVGDSFTNVYSALRGVIEDVGFPLACVVFLALGWSGALLERRTSAVARAFLAMQLAWILWSPIASIFLYNSLLLASALFALLTITLRQSRVTPRTYATST